LKGAYSIIAQKMDLHRHLRREFGVTMRLATAIFVIKQFSRIERLVDEDELTDYIIDGIPDDNAELSVYSEFLEKRRFAESV